MIGDEEESPLLASLYNFFDDHIMRLRERYDGHRDPVNGHGVLGPFMGREDKLDR